MSTVYDYDLHELGEAAFNSIQQKAFSEHMGQDAQKAPAAAAAPSTTNPSPSPDQSLGLLPKVLIGGAVVGGLCLGWHWLRSRDQRKVG
jgi:hypothetical protein